MVVGNESATRLENSLKSSIELGSSCWLPYEARLIGLSPSYRSEPCLSVPAIDIQAYHERGKERNRRSSHEGRGDQRLDKANETLELINVQPQGKLVGKGRVLAMAVPLGASSSPLSILDSTCSNKISFTLLNLPPAHDIPRFTNAIAWRSWSSSPPPITKLYHLHLKRSFSSPRCTEGSSSSNAAAKDDKAAGEETKTPFGYTRKDVLLIGLAVAVVGVGLKSGLEYAGVDPLQAGNVVQLVIVLGLTVGWISTYIFRVSNKEMTYVQQLRDYENKVMEKRLEGLTEAEIEALLEQVEEEKRRIASGEQVQ